MKKQYTILVLALWAVLTACAWFLPDKAVSDAERRPLAQLPEIRLDTVLKGTFMGDFEDYTLDQFPLRDSFRTVKSLFHQYVLGQKDNNGIYLSEGYAAQQEYPLDEASVKHALERFNSLYNQYLADSDIYMAIVPDKGYYLAESSGHLALDYDALYRLFGEGMPWAQQIDLRPVLSIDDYYRTDTHWRQENLIPAAQAISAAMGLTLPQQEDYTVTDMDRPFYGVYYGQAALPMAPDTLSILENHLLSGCTVYDHETGKTGSVYDLSRLEGKDLYEVYLSGPRSLLTIENPSAPTQRELIVFRDSFGSAMIPLLLADYSKITVADIRYIQLDVLERFVEFKGQDVLFLYSTLVLNNSETIK